MYQFPPGATGQSIQVYLRQASDGQAKLGLSPATSGAKAGYARQGGSSVAFGLVALGSATAPWTPGGMFEMDPALTPGLYRFDIPDAAVAVGAGFVSCTFEFDNTLNEGVLILLQNPTNNVGPGGYSWTATIQHGTTPISGASLWVSTDAGGTNVVAGSLVSSVLGQASFLLPAGTFYLWINAPGYQAANPTAFTVAGAGGQTITLTPATAPPALTVSGLHEPRTTVWDLADRLLDYTGADPDERNTRAVRRAILDAIRTFTTSHRWSYLRTFGRLQLSGAYSNSTVTYQASAGTYPYQLTLDTSNGDSWPTWAGPGCYVRIANVLAKVDKRISSSILTMKPPLWNVDYPTGTPFTLYKDTYTLPEDWVAGDSALAETIWGGLTYVQPNQWLSRVRYQEWIGTPVWWTVAGDPDVPGRMAMSIYPTPNVDGTLDFMYYRKPRPVHVFDANAGSASATLSNPNTLTFAQPTLTAQMLGSVVRLAASSGEPPGGIDSLNPYAYEGTITQVVDAQTAIVDAPVPTAFSAVSFRISDPIDAEDLSLTLVGRGAEQALSISKVMKNRADADRAWKEALILAKEADSRVLEQRVAGTGGWRRPRLARMPITFSDV